LHRYSLVCKKWKVKGGGCEAPLALVTVPAKHPSDDFNVKKEEKAQAKEMRDFIKVRLTVCPQCLPTTRCSAAGCI
jgi:hypothetical protein